MISSSGECSRSSFRRLRFATDSKMLVRASLFCLPLAPTAGFNPTAFQAVSFEQPVPRIRQ